MKITTNITNGMKNEEGLMKKLLTGLMMTGLAVTCTLQSAQAKGKGTSGAQFLRIGASARASGMGGAFGALADDASAIYYNPAGLSTLQKKEVSLSYNVYFEDTASQFLGYAHPTERMGTFGVSADMFTVDKIEKRSATGGDADTADLGTFKTRDMALALGWGNKLSLGSSNLNFGLALKYISSDLNTKSAKTGAVDLGLLYKFHDEEGLSLGLSVLNLGGQLKFQDSGDPLPLTVKPSVAYRQLTQKLGKFNFALDGDMMVHDGNGTVQPGLEWWPVSAFAVRTGYQFGRDKNAGSGFSAGVGFRLASLALDYAFVPYGDLGDTHRMSLGFKF